MTLILTVANSKGVHQSSDFRLTDLVTGKLRSDSAGTKQIQATFPNFHLQLAFTGIAMIGKTRTIDWISDELKSFGPSASVQKICDALAKRSAKSLRQYPGYAFTMVIAVATADKPFVVAVISNVRGEVVRGSFAVSKRAITKPFYLVSGLRTCVTEEDRNRLEALARDTERSPEEIIATLKSINSSAAANSHGYVSDQCWATSLSAAAGGNRHWQTSGHGQSGSIVSIQGGIDIMAELRKLSGGKLGRVIVETGMVGRGTPLPAPTGEPRSFTISGGSTSVQLNTPTGTHCASGTIEQLTSRIGARLNETVCIPFANIRFRSAPGLCPDFPLPTGFYPHFFAPFLLNDVSVPRWWQFSIGHWIERGEHHLLIPQVSGAIRNIAFLENKEELMVATKEANWTWPKDGGTVSAILYADVSWRSHL